MIAIDWGTSSLRAYRLARDGTIVEKRSAPLGILAVANRFAETLEQQVGDWIAQCERPIVMSGMIGSRQGWKEAPYVTCPAGLFEIATAMVEVRWGADRRAWIAPGLTCRDESGVPDVMRGEEVQICGALAMLPAHPTWVCLPGTHSKWALVESGRVVQFATYLTGEVFAVLKAHSILGRMMEAGETDLASFDAGVQRSRTAGGLLHHLFGVRALGLFGDLPNARAASYLSGLLIGHELNAVPKLSDTVYVIGTQELAEVYSRALRTFGSTPQILDTDAVVHGLFALAGFLSEEHRT